MSGEVAIVAVWMVFSCSWKIWVELLHMEAAVPLQSSILINVCEGIGIGMLGWHGAEVLPDVDLLLFDRLLPSEVRATYLVL